MRYLFSPVGELAIRQLLGRRVLLAFDFDGTLAPIVPLPDDAHTSSAVAVAMARLCAIAPVAVVTGRAVEDVRTRLGFVPRYIVGNHGAEGLRRDEGGGIERQVALWHREIQSWLLPQGVLVENKRHSLSLHYRLATDRASTYAQLSEHVGRLHPAPLVIGGKCVINLLPPSAPDKHDAVVELMRRSETETVLFLGDDETDEAVFRRASPDWLTARIERQEDSAARYYLNHQSEVASLIQYIERTLRAEQRK